MRKTSRYLIYFVSILVILVTMVGSANLLNDPLYHLPYKRSELVAFTKRYAMELEASPFGLVYVQHDRLIKRELLNIKPSECYVFGSSEGMSIEPQNFPPLQTQCNSFLNISTVVGSFEDFIGMAGKVVQQKEAKQIFVVLSPWFMRELDNEYWNQFPYTVLEGVNTLNSGALLKTLHDVMLVKFKLFSENLSLTYIYDSIQNKYLKEETALQIIPLTKRNTPPHKGDAYTRPNGSHKFSNDWIEARAKSDVEVIKLGKARFTENTVKRWNEIIDNIQKRDIKLTFIIPPYHNTMWDCKNPEVCQEFIDLENEILKLAKKHHVLTYGTYDPRKLDISASGFIDANHIHPIEFKKVANFYR